MSDMIAVLMMYCLTKMVIEEKVLQGSVFILSPLGTSSRERNFCIATSHILLNILIETNHVQRKLHCLTNQYPDHWTDLNSKASYAHRHKILFLFEVVPFVALSSYLFWQTFSFDFRDDSTSCQIHQQMGCSIGLLNMVSNIQKCLHSISKDKDKMQKHPTTNINSTFFNIDLFYDCVSAFAFQAEGHLECAV